MTGKVKFFNEKKGFGFIVAENGKEAFVHFSAIKMDGYKTLKENQAVEFDLVESPKGLKADNVKAINS